MLYLVLTSLILHLVAIGWAVILLLRLRDWRLGFVIGALALVAVIELVALFPPTRLLEHPATTMELVERVGILVVAALLLIMVYAVGAMIGDRERFVQLARQNKERYRNLVDSIDVITWEADAETWRFTFVSEQAEAILGHPIKAWFEDDFWVNHVHPEDRTWVPDFCAEATKQGQGHQFSYRMLHADGSTVWLHDVVSVTMRDGKPWRIHGAMMNITERKRAEEELVASERRYRQLFELNPQSLWVFDRKTLRFLAVNDAAIRTYGYSREEFLSMTIMDIRPPEEVPRLKEALERNSNRKSPGVWRHRKKDGSIIEVEITADDVSFQGREAQLVVAADVTARRHAEEEKRRLEAEREQLLARLELQFDNMPVGCLLTDADLRITDWNPAAERIFGWSREEAMGKNSLKLVVPDDVLPSVDVVLERLRSQRGTIYNTNDNKTRDGRIITCDWQNTAVVDKDGNFVGMLCTVQDVTERISAERALRRSEARLRRVFSANVIGIVFWNSDGAITDANDVFLHMVGYTRDDLQAGRLRSRDLTPSEYAWMDARADAEMASTGVCAPYEKELLCKNGKRVPILMGAGMLEDDRSSGVSFVVDVTPLQRARELFRQSEERYRRLAEHGAMGIWEVRRDGRTVYANPAMCEMLEVASLDDLRGIDYRRFFPPPSIAVMEREQARRLRGEHSTYEVELIGARGGRRCVMISGAPVVTPGQELESFLGTFTDITGLKRAEEALRQSQKMDAVGQLASGVAHDFNNLITAIFGYTSLARRTLSPSHPATRALDRVDAAARQAAGVTRGLLTFSRESPSEKKPIQLGKTVLDTVQLLRRMLPPAIELRAKVDTEGDDWIFADATQIQQVVMNLAINARDAMPDGGRLRISVSAPRPEHGLNGETAGFVSLSVQDTGCGMTQEVCARIFEPFFTTKPPGQGTGLGLPIIHGIVKDHGGMVQIQTNPGEGTTLTVLFPRCEPAPDEPGDPLAGQAPPGRGEVILLAEDQTYVREIISTMLQSLGYKVVQCADSTSLRQASSGLGDQARLMIVDWERQRAISGDVDAAAFRQSAPALPAILMVADPDGMIEDAQTRTFLLRKPFQMSELAAAVARALDKQQEPSCDDTDAHGPSRR